MILIDAGLATALAISLAVIAILVAALLLTALADGPQAFRGSRAEERHNADVNRIFQPASSVALSVKVGHNRSSGRDLSSAARAR
ncbi:MAG: hypothetical protein R3C49_20190 [Planctomycetaceae bacterium]